MQGFWFGATQTCYEDVPVVTQKSVIQNRDVELVQRAPCQPLLASEDVPVGGLKTFLESGDCILRPCPNRPNYVPSGSGIRGIAGV